MFSLRQNMTARQGVTSTATRLTNRAVGGRLMAKDLFADNANAYQCKSCKGKFGADAFYASNQATCKECVKSNVRANRTEKSDYYRSYDRARYRENEHRKEAARKSSASPAGDASRAKSVVRAREETPEKFKARNAVSNGIRDGRIQRGSECYFCGNVERLQAHHYDYTKPLDVFWLCSGCHGKLHTINGDFHRDRAAGPSDG